MNMTEQVEVKPLAVRMHNIHKRFGTVQANDAVSLSVRAATVHALVGENGAGKSTLMSVLYGFYQADEGEIEIEGRPVRIPDAHAAIALGLGMVHQHFMLVDRLSALDNILLGAEQGFFLRRAQAMARERLLALMQSSGLVVDLDARVGDLSVGDRQRLEILKALYRGARILILDEPTAVLTPAETEQLFAVLAKLREQGCTVILITHKLKEVMRLCDQVTVMRAGRVVHECAIAETTVEQLAEAMVGRKVSLGRSEPAEEVTGEIRLVAEGLRFTDAMGCVRLKEVSLSLRAGEIVGVAGVAGNGQSELLAVLSGLVSPQAGRLKLGAQTFGVMPGERWLDPRIARQLGLAHVPEDRHARAMVMDFPAWESAVLGYEALPAYSHKGWMRRAAMMAATAAMMSRFDVRPPLPQLGSSKFSGGNQQKLVLAREIGQNPVLLLVGQPTRGVDIGAIEFIHARLRELRDAGCSVLVVSSELDEILALADRVLVMNAGRITGELPIEACDEKTLGMLMSETDVAQVAEEAEA
ncbi:ABC transporter ATP-binding protein [Uliginosibacterium sp. TH139]|uniref:ABC transporter ATP-binding protein n=1 Tax=Uliginosibacterium sp. TH139 TaxID=2067453 RepID=UPI00156E8E1E|nr:ABC transporter ATP-binding protein [Uliginosibacterium sp. TH139]